MMLLAVTQMCPEACSTMVGLECLDDSVRQTVPMGSAGLIFVDVERCSQLSSLALRNILGILAK